jgi:quinol-cytochrome oxidoreductase complex cytochrome b subunit
MRDVNFGWLIRYTHANVASFFFIFVYLQYKFIIALTYSLNSFFCYLYRSLIGTKFNKTQRANIASRKYIGYLLGNDS